MSFPELPYNPHLGMMLEGLNLLGQTQDIDDYKPLSNQYAIKVGDHVIAAGTSAGIDNTFTIGIVLDPEEYKTKFPDWEERLMKSYLLVQWHARDDAIGDIGWFSRVKLIPVDEDHYLEILGYMENQNWPETYPEWLLETYEGYTDALHEQQPLHIPKRAYCKLCGSRDTEIHASRRVVVAVKAGEVEFKGEPRYVGISPVQHDCYYDAHIHCNSCNGRGEMEDYEWAIDWPHS